MLKHIYEKSKNDPNKRRAWKSQQDKYNNTYRDYRKKENRGELDRINNTEDMSRLVKYAKQGQSREVALVKFRMFRKKESS